MIRIFFPQFLILYQVLFKKAGKNQKKCMRKKAKGEKRETRGGEQVCLKERERAKV